MAIGSSKDSQDSGKNRSAERPSRFWSGTVSMAKGLGQAAVQMRFLATGEDGGGFLPTAKGEAQAFDTRVKIQKALDKIEKEGFYTLGGVVSLMREHYARQRDEAFEKSQEAYEKSQDKALSSEERAEWHEKHQEWRTKHLQLLQDTERRLKGRSITRQLRRLLDAAEADKLCRVPKGNRLKLINDFFEESGFMTAPVPVNWIKRKPDVLRSVVYAGAGNGDLVYHSLRLATGADDPGRDFKETDLDPKPFAGAVFQSYVFDNPYLKRGVFVVRPGDQRNAVEVEYYEGWTSGVPSSDQSGHTRVTQRYEDFYRGYLVDQGYDSYIFLFGPQDPSLKFKDGYNAMLAVQGLQQLLSPRTPTADGAPVPAPWNAAEQDVSDYLRGLDDQFVIDTLRSFLEQTDTAVQSVSDQSAEETAVAAQQGAPGTQVALYRMATNGPAYRADFTGRNAADPFLNDPSLQNDRVLQNLPSLWQQPSGPDMEAEARELKKAIWALFEVDGRPEPKPGDNRRIRTLYLEGANRNALTPNMLKGSVVAFDNTSKSEMLLERTVMYRLSMPTANPVELANWTVMARNNADRFDMRKPDSDARSNLAYFEPKFREIFLSLGYDVAPITEETKPYRVDPLVSNTASDAEDMEFVIE